MITASATAIEWAAEIIDSILRRAGSPIEAADRALSASLESAAWAATLLPPPIVIGLFGLLVWRGQHLVRAVVVVTALQLVLLSELWTNALETVLLGLVAGGIGVLLALGFTTATRPLRKWFRWARQPGASIAVSLVTVLVIAITALFGAPVKPAWNLGAIVLAAGLALSAPWLGMRELMWQRLGVAVLELGLAAALLIGLASGAGLGGLAVRSARTGDIALSLQVLLAMMGLAIALVAATTLPPQPTEQVTDDEPGTPSRSSDQAGDRA